VSDHRPGRSALLDRHEADRLVEATRRIPFGHAETESRVSLANTGVDEVDEEPPANSLVSTGRDDCDRQFGDTFGDEAKAMARLGERPIPSRAHRSVLFGNQSIVTVPRPSGEVQRVAGIGEHLVSGRCRLVGAPDCGLAEHGCEKGEVLGLGRATPNVCHSRQSSSSAIRVRDHGSRQILAVIAEVASFSVCCVLEKLSCMKFKLTALAEMA
jgi:hypothetical protein